MRDGDDDYLDRLLRHVSHKLSLKDFCIEVSLFWRRELRQRTNLSDIRFRHGDCKKLMDEIMPVVSFLRWKRLHVGHICFSLSDVAPDCLLWPLVNVRPVGIEVTVTQGMARHLLQKELAENGTGRGFSEIQDDDDFDAASRSFQEPSSGYTTEQALKSVEKGILAALKRKNNKKYCGMSLIIQAPMNEAVLPRARWKELPKRLISPASDMPFSEIYVIGDGSRNTICFQIGSAYDLAYAVFGTATGSFLTVDGGNIAAAPR